MKLFIIRHGYDDFNEPESAGRREAKAAAAVVYANAERLGFHPRFDGGIPLLTSPAHRAKNTATVFADGVQALLAPTVVPWLTDDEEFRYPMRGLQQYLGERDLSKYTNPSVLFLVTHRPTGERLITSFGKLFGLRLRGLPKLDRTATVVVIDDVAHTIERVYPPTS